MDTWANLSSVFPQASGVTLATRTVLGLAVFQEQSPWIWRSGGYLSTAVDHCFRVGRDQRKKQSDVTLLFCLTSTQNSTKNMHTQSACGVLCVSLSVCVCASVCICASVCVCVCVLDGKGSKVFASRAPLQMTMHLTSYSDCQTGFHEPFSPLYKCYTSLKNV